MPVESPTSEMTNVSFDDLEDGRESEAGPLFEPVEPTADLDTVFDRKLRAEVFEPVREDPPAASPRSGRVSTWYKRLSPLMDEPSQWFRVLGPATYQSLNSRISNIRKGRVRGLEPKDWEFLIRSKESASVRDSYWLYVRYVDDETRQAEKGYAKDRSVLGASVPRSKKK